MNSAVDTSASGLTQTCPRPPGIVLSVLLTLHLCAVVIAPLSVAPASILSHRCWQVFRPYLQIVYLNHGYHFFAPEPGPSHLIRYELNMPDGTRLEGIFPNSEQHRPRLAYHRHFMLTEFLNTLVSSDADPKMVDKLTRSYAQHLLETYGADRATLFLRRHYIPSPEQVQNATRLDDQVLYAEKPLGTFTKDRL